jgi:hypothetical protein
LIIGIFLVEISFQSSRFFFDGYFKRALTGLDAGTAVLNYPQGNTGHLLIGDTN